MGVVKPHTKSSLRQNGQTEILGERSVIFACFIWFLCPLECDLFTLLWQRRLSGKEEGTSWPQEEIKNESFTKRTTEH